MAVVVRTGEGVGLACVVVATGFVVVVLFVAVVVAGFVAVLVAGFAVVEVTVAVGVTLLAPTLVVVPAVGEVVVGNCMAFVEGAAAGTGAVPAAALVVRGARAMSATSVEGEGFWVGCAVGVQDGSSVACTERDGIATVGLPAPPTTCTAPTDSGPLNS